MPQPTYPSTPIGLLTAREYIAAQVLAGLAVGWIDHGLTPDASATMAVELADALIARLNGSEKRPPTDEEMLDAITGCSSRPKSAPGKDKEGR